MFDSTISVSFNKQFTELWACRRLRKLSRGILLSELVDFRSDDNALDGAVSGVAAAAARQSQLRQPNRWLSLAAVVLDRAKTEPNLLNRRGGRLTYLTGRATRELAVSSRLAVVASTRCVITLTRAVCETQAAV